jgi:hypothetical protein
MKSVLIAAVLALGFLPGGDDKVVPLKVGDPAPDMTGKWIDYAAPDSKLSDMQGSFVLVEFWRTW